MSQIATCACGHVFDEHGQLKEYPGSLKCGIPGCDCLAFEEDFD